MKRIFLAITCNNHFVFDACAESVLRNCAPLIENGHKVMPYFANDLYIDRARNLSVDIFLKTDCTDLIFIDADLRYPDDAMLKLMVHDRPVVAGAYPLKKPGTPDFPIKLRFNTEYNCMESETGLVFARMAPTGLMRIQRLVFDFLIENATPSTDEEGVYQFFRTGVCIDGDPNWWGEDSYFCRKWLEAGGEIFVEPRIDFVHYGIRGYKGNFHEHLLSRSVENLDKNKTGIDGWMSDTELSILKYLSGKCQSVVEIGSWKGRSTKALLESCPGKVYAVDHWKGSAGDLTSEMVKLNSVLKEFMNNVGGHKNLTVLEGESQKIAAEFDKTVDMVFIDAGHNYEDVKADIESWLPKAKKIICGHDYSAGHKGVKQAVDELLGSVHVIDTIWFKEL